MKKYLFPVGLLLILGCNKLFEKVPNPDLAGTGTLKGIVVIADTLSGRYTFTAVPGITVYLKYTGDTTGFLYSSTANNQGLYTFNGIDTSIGYTVYAATENNAVRYDGKLAYTAGNFNDAKPDSIKLYPSENNQNGIHLVVQDTTLAKVSGTTAWIFNSRFALFSSDSAAQKAFDIVTNEFGVGNRLNVAPGWYYARVRTKINGTDYKGEDSAYVEATKIKTLTVLIRRQPAVTNGMELLVLDKDSTPVQGAQLFGYRSRSVSLLDSANAQAEFVLPSSASGMASLYNIDSAKYYIRSLKQVGSVALRSYDSVMVDKARVTKQIIRLKAM